MSKVPRSSPPIPATCQRCGVEFVPTRGASGRYCGVLCANRSIGETKIASNTVGRPGDRFGEWTVLKEVEKRGRRRVLLCRCSCGLEKPLLLEILLRGDSTKCRSCASRAMPRPARPPGKSQSPEYSCWHAMRQRCSNPHNASYSRYGGRGIKVCDRWQLFDNFLADMGPRPSLEHTLDRLDNNKDYEPSNTRWSSADVQQNNKRSCTYLTAEGRTQTVKQWARELGIHHNTLRKRINSGWNIEQALAEPIRPREPGQPNRLRHDD